MVIYHQINENRMTDCRTLSFPLTILQIPGRTLTILSENVDTIYHRRIRVMGMGLGHRGLLPLEKKLDVVYKTKVSHMK